MRLAMISLTALSTNAVEIGSPLRLSRCRATAPVQNLPGCCGRHLAVEAYHAGTLRTLLYQMGQARATAKISALRASASGAADDQGVVMNGPANIVPTDHNGLAFSRTNAQVLNIVYLGGASANYGFFPKGLNGTIA
jgi:hypothetical protein